MISANEDMLICDLAETYGILDYRSMPPCLIATFCVGLRENSRIKLFMQDCKVDMSTAMLACAVDSLALLVWAKTKDGQNGVRRPKSVLNLISGTLEQTQIYAVSTPEEFEAARAEILEEYNGNRIG